MLPPVLWTFSFASTDRFVLNLSRYELGECNKVFSWSYAGFQTLHAELECLLLVWWAGLKSSWYLPGNFPVNTLGDIQLGCLQPCDDAWHHKNCSCLNHLPTYSMSGEGCSAPVFEFHSPTMNTLYHGVSHIKQVFSSQTSFLFLKSSLCSVLINLVPPWIL